MERHEFLEASRFKADEGKSIGKHLADVTSVVLSLKFRAQSLKAIREKCLDCWRKNAADIRKCGAVDCPLWPYRMGTNPSATSAIFQPLRNAKGPSA